MNTPFFYAQIIEEIRAACLGVIDQQKNGSELQSVLQKAEDSIVAVEERQLRDSMTDFEGQIELAFFTLEGKEQSNSLATIAAEILKTLDQKS